jgi:hypothetical protein
MGKTRYADFLAVGFTLAVILLGAIASRAQRAPSETYLPIVLDDYQAKFLPPLLITEVLYDPASEVDEPGGEWIEIYNTTADWLPLEGYKIGDSETIGDGESMYHFPLGAWLPPGGLAVVPNRADVFSQRYGRDPDFELVASSNSVPLLQKYTGWSTGNLVLSNSGDELLVLDEFDQVVDALSYGDSLWAFAPPIPRVPEGYSLERYPANQDTDQARDWRAQPMPNP